MRTPSEDLTMSTAATAVRLTPDEYLQRERAAPFRSEFLNGFVTATAGASREHNLIVGNLVRDVGIAFRGRPCEVYSSDMRVCVRETGLYTYPDVVAVCGGARFLEGGFDTLVNPTVIVEVLSPTTEAGDRGSRFAHYRRLPSLREYVLIAQDRVMVERFTRQGDDWRLTEFSRLEDALALDSIGCAMPLSEIYARVVPGAAEEPVPATDAGS